MPDRIRAVLRRTRRRTGSGPAVGIGVGIVIAVLIVTVAVSVLLTQKTPAPVSADPGTGAAIENPSPTVAPTSAIPESPSPSPSESTSEAKPDPDKTTDHTDDPAKAASDPTYPAGGTYRIKPAHTGLCLGIGPEPGHDRTAVLVQDSCSQAAPALKMVKLTKDTVGFSLYFADYDWEACLGIDTPGASGYLYGPKDCNGGALQTFKLVPTSGGRYLIKSSASGLCMDFPWDATAEGAQVGAQSCSPGSSSQQFGFG